MGAPLAFFLLQPLAPVELQESLRHKSLPPALGRPISDYLPAFTEAIFQC